MNLIMFNPFNQFLKLLIVCFLFINNCFSQVTNTQAGLWSNQSLWNMGEIPQSTDSVYLSYDITIDVNATCRILNTNGNNVIVDNGASLTISSGPNDFDGHLYTAISICNQLWTKENLNVAHYKNGDTIPQVTDSAQWLNLTTGAWCYYNNDSANGIIYGKLYNWYAVHDARGLAPDGWHIPGFDEWMTVLNCLGGSFVAGGKMKETGLTHWATPNNGASNSSNFTGLPGGQRGVNGNSFVNLNTYGYFWSSEETDMYTAWFNTLIYSDFFTNLGGFDKRLGLSVRCMRN